MKCATGAVCTHGLEKYNSALVASPYPDEHVKWPPWALWRRLQQADYGDVSRLARNATDGSKVLDGYPFEGTLIENENGETVWRMPNGKRLGTMLFRSCTCASKLIFRTWNLS